MLDWWLIGTALPGKPSGSCQKQNNRVRSAVRRVTSMESTTSSNASAVSNGSRAIPGERAAFSRTPGAFPRASTCPHCTPKLFIASRESQVDIVQAVGRIMWKAEGKECGYIVLPVAVPAGVEPDKALDDDERFAVVWSVYARAALARRPVRCRKSTRSTSPTRPTDRIIVSGDGIDGPNDGSSPLADCPFRRWICPRPARSSPRSSRNAATGSTGKPGPRTWPTSSRGLSTGNDKLLS